MKIKKIQIDVIERDTGPLNVKDERSDIGGKTTQGINNSPFDFELDTKYTKNILQLKANEDVTWELMHTEDFVKSGQYNSQNNSLLAP